MPSATTSTQSKANLANIALSKEGDVPGLAAEDLEFLFGDGAERMAA